MAGEQFSLCWDNFHKNMSSGMHSLLESGDLVDVTLAVEGKYLKAHKMVLSVCSPYFRELFQNNPCKHPIMFMKDVSYIAMSDLLTFMYQGEVQVNQENLATFIKTAEALQIKGLTGDGNGEISDVSEEIQIEKEEMQLEKPTKRTIEVSAEISKSTQRPRKLSSGVKRPKLSTPVQDVDVSKEDAMTVTPSVQFKMEPYESVDQTNIENIDDSQAETFGDETLDDSHMEDTEDYSMLEGEDPQVGTSGDGMGDSQGMAVMDLLPKKSMKIYEGQFERFLKWCHQKKVEDYNEKVLLDFFSEESKKFKCSTLWAHYSMLKSMLLLKRNVDISKFPQLLAFLKRQNRGYVPKKSKIFTRDEIYRFIQEAPDNKYLLMKVVLIMGVAGACRKKEIIKMNVDNIQDIGSALIVVIPDAKTGVPRTFTVTDDIDLNFLQIFRKYSDLRPPCDHRRFFINYQLGKCTKQPVGINKIGKIPGQIAKYLKLPNAEYYTGHSFRRTSATLLVDERAYIATLKRHAGWRSTTVAEGCIENSMENKMEIAKLVTSEVEENSDVPSDIHNNDSSPTSILPL